MCLPDVQADKYGVPRICFVNKMDRMGADFFNTVKMIVSNLGATPAVLQVQTTGLLLSSNMWISYVTYLQLYIDTFSVL